MIAQTCTTRTLMVKYIDALLFKSYNILVLYKLQQDAVGDGRLRPWCRHLAISTKQRCLTSDWCHNRKKWTKHKRNFWFWPIPFIIWKPDVIHKTWSRHT